MRKLNYQLLLFCLTISCSFYATSGTDNCSDGPQYGYGKLFYNGVTHTIEDVYPLRLQHKYNATKSIKNNNTSKEYSSQPLPIEVVINGRQLDSEVKVVISVENKSKKIVVIPKKNIAFNGALSNPIFSIVSECIRLDYIGQIVNFGSTYQYPDDYVVIKPSHKYVVEVVLGDYYHFLPGVYTYEIFIPEIPFSIEEDIEGNEQLARSNILYLTVKG